MKRIIILFILLVQVLFLFSQNLQLTWQQCFGGTEWDYARDIYEINSRYLIAGSTKSNDGNVSFNHGATDGWLIKTNSIGELEWEKTYGGSNGDGIFRIFSADENNYYLLCSSYSSDGDISNDPYPESTDFWIVKIDSSGNILWEKILGGNILDQMWTGTPTADGGVVAFGWTGSQDGDVTVNYGAYDMWMVKVNSEGEKEWDFSIGTNDFDYGQAIIQTSDEGFLVGGTSTIGEGGNLTCEPFNDYGEAILVKLDADRNIEWQQCYGGSGHDGITAITEVSDGYLFAGYVNSNDGDISGWHGENDIWVVKVDIVGNIIWQKCLGGSRSEYTSKLIITDEVEIIIPGNTQSNNGDVSGNHTLSEYDHDIWMVKLSSEGVLLSQQCFGGEGDDRIDFGVVKKSDNNFVIAGQTDYGPSFDVACTPHGGNGIDRDLWVFEIDSIDTSGIIGSPFIQNSIKVYPNPAKDYVIFETTLTHTNRVKYKIIVSDVFGQEVVTLSLKNEKTVWDCREAINGTYIYCIQSGLNVIDRGKIVILK